MIDWWDVQRQWWKIHWHLLKQISIIAILCDGNYRDYILISIKPNNHWHLARTLLNLVPLKLSLVGQFWGDPIMHKSCKDDLMTEKAPQQWCCLLCTCTVVLFTLTDREKVRRGTEGQRGTALGSEGGKGKGKTVHSWSLYGWKKYMTDRRAVHVWWARVVWKGMRVKRQERKGKSSPCSL